MNRRRFLKFLGLAPLATLAAVSGAEKIAPEPEPLGAGTQVWTMPGDPDCKIEIKYLVVDDGSVLRSEEKNERG